MSDATVRGIVHFIDDTKTYGQKGFRKRQVVLEQDNGRFTNYIPVEFVHDSCDDVDGMNVGDEVDVTYRLTGRKWQRDPNSEIKYFLNAEATSFKVVGGGGKVSGDVASANDALSEAANDDDDDVPF